MARPGRGRPAPEPGERTRRRFARRQWARRWGVWRRLLLAGGVVAVLGAGVWVVWFSQVLAVESVEVRGAEVLSDAQVREAAAIAEGEPLAALDLSRVEGRLRSLAPVREARVERRWPDGVLVSIEERVAVAVVELGGSSRGMDGEGVVFTEFEKAPPDLPRVRVVGRPDRDALREAAHVVAALPDELADRVDHVDVETVDQISLALGDGRVVRWGSAEQSEDKAAVLGALLTARKARQYDVSVPGQPVLSD